MNDNGEDLQPLDVLDKQEFRDSTRHLVDWTEEEFDKHWAEFQEMKRKRGMN